MVLNLQKRLHEAAVAIEKAFFTEEEREWLPDYLINVGHFNREHGHHLGSWLFESGLELAEIYIDAQAFNKGPVYIWSILHHELVMLYLRGMGTGSFDSRTKEFADSASRKGLAVYETSDRFKFRSAKKLEEHRDEWLEFYKDNVEHYLNKILVMIEAVIYPDLVSKRMVDAFDKAYDEGSFYPTPGGLLKPGTGGRAKRDYKFVKVKVTKDTEEDEVISEAKNQYQDIHTKLLDKE